jgi:hypothetical protein
MVFDKDSGLTQKDTMAKPSSQVVQATWKSCAGWLKNGTKVMNRRKVVYSTKTGHHRLYRGFFANFLVFMVDFDTLGSQFKIYLQCALCT